MPPSDLHKTHSLARLEDIARQSYRHRRFEEALEALDAAKTASHDSLNPELLDLRAATLCKLDKHKLALADARKIIDGDEALPLGYLRAGRILTELDKPGRALQIYQRGLRFCKASSTRYDLLQREAGKLSATSSAVDFFPRLPTEIVHQVLGYLELHAKLKILKVCKSWRELVKESARLWTHLDFTITRKPVRPKDVETVTGYARGRVKALGLKGVAIQGNRLLEIILRRNKDMESLTLMSGGRLERTLTNALKYGQNIRHLRFGGRVELDLKTAAELLKICPGLQTCNFAGVLQRSPISTDAPAEMHNLSSFTVETSDMALRHLNPSCLIKATSALRELRVSSKNLQFKMNLDTIFSDATTLDTLHLEGSYACVSFGSQFGMLSRSLSSLALIHTGLASGGNAAAEADFLDAFRAENNGAAYFSKLEHLRLKELEGGTDIDSLAATLLKGSGSALETLEVGGGGAALSSEPLSALLALPRLRSLRRLALSKKITLDDTHAQNIADTFKDLREVDLSNTSLTGVGVKALVLGLPHLHTLSILDCVNIRRDAVDWAEGKGVKVFFGQVSLTREFTKSWSARRGA